MEKIKKGKKTTIIVLIVSVTLLLAANSYSLSESEYFLRLQAGRTDDTYSRISEVSEDVLRQRMFPAKPVYYGPGTTLYDNFSHRRSISSNMQQRNIELILFGLSIESLSGHSDVHVFNLGSGVRPLQSFGKYVVTNFDPDFPRQKEIRWQASEEAKKVGAKFERKEITDITEKCSVAIWYDLIMFIYKYAKNANIWKDTEGDTKSREKQVLDRCIMHTWSLIEDGGYFIIAGKHFPRRWPKQVYEEIISLNFDISEIIIVGESIDRAEAIILRKRQRLYNELDYGNFGGQTKAALPVKNIGRAI